jgi:hypothetical protein
MAGPENPEDFELEGAILDTNPKHQVGTAWHVRSATSTQSGNKLMLRYYLVSRRAFHGAQYLSVSVDASRLSRRGMLLGVACLPTNVAAWLPPQVRVFVSFLCGMLGVKAPRRHFEGASKAPRILPLP